MFAAPSNAPVHRATPHNRGGNARWQKDQSSIVLQWNHKRYEFLLTPLTIAATSCTAVLMFLALLLGSGYLYLKDDLLSASISRQMHMQHAYEDRITSLRAQVDLITSRQLLDQRAVETRVSELMKRQSELQVLQGEVNKVTKRASSISVFSPTPKTSKKKPNVKTKGLRLGSLTGSTSPFVGQSSATVDFNTVAAAPKVFDTMEASLLNSKKQHLARVQQLKRKTDQKARKLASILSREGIRVPKDLAVGGPLIELKSGSTLLDSVQALDNSLDIFEKVRRAANSLPHGSPVPGQKISSRFGSRKDPFTGRTAVHGGLDFRAKRGVRVYATAAGKITKAGRMGGYGKIVEIDHGGGITTRYAHLSRIKVKVGQRIKRGHRIGNVGSTGRSTGPHLHYEVRRKGRVLNPIHYVRLAKRLKPYL